MKTVLWHLTAYEFLFGHSRPECSNLFTCCCKMYDIWVVSFTDERKIFSIITNVLGDLITLDK